jgi:hypothetical protein
MTAKHTPDDVLIKSCLFRAELTEQERIAAAAPDMLAALEAVVAHIDSLPGDTERCRILKLALNNRAGDMVFAAIAKARGE